jgi:hypothetical protein
LLADGDAALPLAGLVLAVVPALPDRLVWTKSLTQPPMPCWPAAS